eukprot:2426237-Ditylum_brightwellii.AAC.1
MQGTARLETGERWIGGEMQQEVQLDRLSCHFDQGRVVCILPRAKCLIELDVHIQENGKNLGQKFVYARKKQK